MRWEYGRGEENIKTYIFQQLSMLAAQAASVNCKAKKVKFTDQQLGDYRHNTQQSACTLLLIAHTKFSEFSNNWHHR